MRFATYQRFPEVYTGGEAPDMYGVFDHEKQAGTPVYAYGWVISRAELYEALNGEPCPWDRLLTRIYVVADRRFYALWREKGYDKNEYNPNSPGVKGWGPKYVVIYLTCNDSADIIRSIMENKKYHAACRESMGNPKAMEMEPAWIRGDLEDLPKGLMPSLNDV